MPRVGRHPLKVKGLVDEVRQQRITVTTIVHIPTLEGYWAQSLDVLKLFFDSLFASTDQPFDLMVFDNNSCAEVQDHLLGLRREGRIQYLTLCEYNLRKLGALNYLLSTAPGEFVAYADSDVYFLRGWLERSLEVLEAFPEAGKVTALPIVGGDTSAISAQTFAAATADPSMSVETGLLVPDEYVDAHRLSLGLSREEYLPRLEGRKDVRLSRGNVSAYLSAADFQFTITRTALQDVLPLRVEKGDIYYDPIYSPELEAKLDAAGLWQLSTVDYLVHHMGNRVPDLGAELPWIYGDSATTPPLPRKEYAQRSRVTQNRFVRSVLKRLNVLTYRLLYER